MYIHPVGSISLRRLMLKWPSDASIMASDGSQELVNVRAVLQERGHPASIQRSRLGALLPLVELCTSGNPGGGGGCDSPPFLPSLLHRHIYCMFVVAKLTLNS